MARTASIRVGNVQTGCHATRRTGSVKPVVRMDGGEPCVMNVSVVQGSHSNGEINLYGLNQS